jgi:hypothetical protein
MNTPNLTNCPTCKHYFGTYCARPTEQCQYEGNFPNPIIISQQDYDTLLSANKAATPQEEKK